ncbi:hypothetical protein Glove_299g46 [Diversispora epigaea]|uniref:Uncharacterized protein n=1 Tax=Diversispora epigaea TaxID=1348612 RepID=A0A397I3K1_9GLOM|nr:hypothetical protein Glove_299g46 [Diversispora epigaea]
MSQSSRALIVYTAVKTPFLVSSRYIYENLYLSILILTEQALLVFEAAQAHIMNSMVHHVSNVIGSLIDNNRGISINFFQGFKALTSNDLNTLLTMSCQWMTIMWSKKNILPNS